MKGEIILFKRVITIFSIFMIGLLFFGNHSVQAFSEESLEISDQLLDDKVVHIETMSEAYEVFKDISDQLEFKDIAEVDSQGSSQDDVEALLDLNVKTESYEIMDNITVLYYVFESEEVFEELDDSPKNTDLAFLFADDQLIGVTILAHSF